jgi:hypothetical protein
MVKGVNMFMFKINVNFAGPNDGSGGGDNGGGSGGK